MKFKELLPALTFAFLITFALQYFFPSHKAEQTAEEQLQSGQRVAAPRAAEVLKPLNIEVDFLDVKSSKKPVVTDVVTEHALYEFSTEGASLQRVEFKRNWGGKEGYLSTVFPPPSGDREQRSLLVALGEKTPFYYDLVETKTEHDRTELTYSASYGDGTVTKQFVVFHHQYRIDCTITLEPKQGTTVQPRILFPSPLVPELGDKDVIFALANDKSNNVQVSPKSDELLHEYWVKPTLFGSQDRYFIHAMIDDVQNFAQRGYYKISDFASLYAILEGPEVSAKTTWTLGFYFGPKEDDAILMVDPRLQQTLNYGWLAPISRPVSKLFLQILNLLYGFVHNYGLAIILFTLAMRLILVPFTWRAEQSRGKQVEFQRKLKYIESKFKDDKEALNEARADLIKKHGMPGLGGCLPLLFQIPLFIALSWVLSNSIELYMAPFLWIPDLSAPDPLYILPILIGVTMLFNAPVPDPRQRVTAIIMGLVFAAFSASLASGLALYIFVSTLLGVVQMAIVKRV